MFLLADSQKKKKSAGIVLFYRTQIGKSWNNVLTRRQFPAPGFPSLRSSEHRALLAAGRALVLKYLGQKTHCSAVMTITGICIILHY